MCTDSCAILIDLFQYSNSYALVGGSKGLALSSGDAPEDGQTDPGIECSAYVSAPEQPIQGLTLLKYYARLQPGQTVGDWVEQNSIHLTGIDVRRMMSFGVIKGFLRRCHCYPIWLDHPDYRAKGNAKSTVNGQQESKAATPSYPSSLPKMLDGQHHTDEICTKYRVGFGYVSAHLDLQMTRFTKWLPCRSLRKWLIELGGLTEDEAEGRRTDLGQVQLVYL